MIKEIEIEMSNLRVNPLTDCTLHYRIRVGETGVFRVIAYKSHGGYGCELELIYKGKWGRWDLGWIDGARGLSTPMKEVKID